MFGEQEGLEFVGFGASEVDDVVSLLCSVLHIGNIAFGEVSEA